MLNVGSVEELTGLFCVIVAVQIIGMDDPFDHKANEHDEQFYPFSLSEANSEIESALKARGRI